MATQAGDQATVASRRGAGWFLTAGVLFIVVGALALVEPLFTSVAVGVFLGVSFMFAGAIALGAGIANMGHKGGWIYLLLGLIGVLAGVFMAVRPLAVAVSLVWIIGFFLMFTGVFELAAAFRAQTHRGWMFAVAGVNIVLGILLVDIDPLSAVHFLAFVVALSFVMRGIASIVYAREIRRLSQA